MNLALPALIVFALLLPGFIFRSRFKRAERTSVDYSPFGQVVTEAVIWAGVLHALWLALTWLIRREQLEFHLLLGLMSSDSATQARSISEAGHRGAQLALYFGTMLAGSYAVPSLARRLVVRLRLDRQGSPLSDLVRFHAAPWYYLLSGADFSERDKPDFIQVSAVVDAAGEATLYTGVLEDYFIGEDGQLDRVVLSATMRRPLVSDKASDDVIDSKPSVMRSIPSPHLPQGERFYEIDGDYFVLRYSEAITLNIQYHRFKREEVIDQPQESSSL